MRITVWGVHLSATGSVNASKKKRIDAQPLKTGLASMRSQSSIANQYQSP
jgi:hypothetical protein